MNMIKQALLLLGLSLSLIPNSSADAPATKSLDELSPYLLVDQAVIDNLKSFAKDEQTTNCSLQIVGDSISETYLYLNPLTEDENYPNFSYNGSSHCRIFGQPVIFFDVLQTAASGMTADWGLSGIDGWGGVNNLTYPMSYTDMDLGRNPIGQQQAYPEFATILFGTNDIRSWLRDRYTWDQSAEGEASVRNYMLQNLQGIVEWFKQRGVIPMLMTIPPGRYEAYEFIPQGENWGDRQGKMLGSVWADSVRLLGRQMQIPVLDINQLFLDQANWQAFFDDGVHPNQAGYQLLNPVAYQAYEDLIELVFGARDGNPPGDDDDDGDGNGDGDGDTDPDPTPLTSQFCQAYSESPLFRERANQLTVTPQDNWIQVVESAEPGTEILFEAGTYYLGDRYTALVEDDLTLRSSSGNRDDVVIMGNGYGDTAEALMVVGSNVVIADLTITQVRNHAISIKGNQNADNPIFYNLNLIDIGTQHIKLTPGGSKNGLIACSSIGYSENGVQGDYIDAIDLHQPIDWVIRDNTIYNINGDGSGCEVDIDCGTYVSGPAILVWNNAQGTIIERNILRNNFRNIALGLGSGHSGGIVRNNFIYRDAAGDAGIEIQGASDNEISNNTVLVNGYRGVVEVRDSNAIRIYNNLMNAAVYDRGNAEFVADGNIVDGSINDITAPDDPHLVAGSRAIGAGIVLGEGSDIDGDLRERRWDVGADQFNGELAPPPESGEEIIIELNNQNASDVAIAYEWSGNIGASSYLIAGRDWQEFSRSFIQFDWSSLKPQGEINQVFLELYLAQENSPGNYFPLSAHQVLEGWQAGQSDDPWGIGAGATWSRFEQPGGQHQTDPLSLPTSISEQDFGSYVSFDITQATRNWQQGETNNGVLLKPVEGLFPDWVNIYFDSLEAGNKPRLRVVMQNNNQ